MSDDPAGWSPMYTAPKDGREIILHIEHPTIQYARAEERDDWQEDVHAHWIDFNGGGWTYYGLCGTPTRWKPI